MIRSRILLHAMDSEQHLAIYTNLGKIISTWYGQVEEATELWGSGLKPIRVRLELWSRRSTMNLNFPSAFPHLKYPRSSPLKMDFPPPLSAARAAAGGKPHVVKLLATRPRSSGVQG